MKTKYYRGVLFSVSRKIIKVSISLKIGTSEYVGLSVLKLGNFQAKWYLLVILDCIPEVGGGYIYLSL